MPSNLSTRTATSADVPLINQLATQIWEPTYCSILSRDQIAYMFEVIYTQEALLKQMEAGQVFLLLYEKTEAIGFAALSLKDAGKAVYKLNKLYLLPKAQGKGAGRRLLEAVEQEVKTKGGAVLELNVNRYNMAKAFYESCGYAVVREEDIPIGPFWMNDYVMEKRIH